MTALASQHEGGWLSLHHRRPYVAALGLSLLAVIPYLNAPQGDFCFDDTQVIRDNPMVTGPMASALKLISTPLYLGKPYYRPIIMLTYFANARLNASPVGYHVVNILLHMFVTLAVFRLACILLDSTLAGAVTAALFAVHPVHTEAVTNIVGRAELLVTLLTVAAVLALIRATRGHQSCHRGWLAASVACVALGVLTKESALTAIPLCAIAYLWINPFRRTLRSLWLLVPYSCVVIAYLGIRLALVGALTLPEKPQILDNPLALVPLAPRLETALVILWQYLAQLTVPLRLSADYSYNEIPVVASALDTRFLGATVLFTGLAIALMLSRKRAPALALAAAFFAVPLMLTANMLFPIGTIKAERLLYLPSLGWCLGGAWLITRVPEPQRQRSLMAVALVVVAFAGRTWMRNRDWQDNFTLFSATVQTAGRSAKAHHNLAVAYEGRGDFDNAMLQFRESLAIYPAYEEAAFGIGKIYEKKGIDAGALEWYATATRLNPNWARAHLNSGAIHYKYGEFTAAETDFRAGLESEPDDPRLLIGLALTRLAQNDRAEAETLLGRATSLADGDRKVAALLAKARQRLDRTVTQ